ncbi:hypothetical protein [Paenibacillus wynnii]|uniref:Uncharacterized protein n=1 Tax=Paenibacillus wynnii TaxID=268407 RepID=A0A098M7K3_9BACL|nr:hypothetical protein [Paenibacillus wynnii]KGE18559.1 hypothetical protein PWYN_03645 [Paenibacillus wynnii]
MGYALSNGILTVDIADLVDYKGSRFDRTGFITQVTLEPGKHTFCVPESLISGKGTGGQGLCNEFGISRAIGYDTAPVGGWFPKPGVGLLQKQNNYPYQFNTDYLVNPFKVNVEAGLHEIQYTIQPLECRGYSIQLTKTISLCHDKLNISYKMHNKGSQHFQTEEYIHNFIGIDNHEVDYGYELRLPGSVRIEEPESAYTSELLQISKGRISWNKSPDRPFYCKLGGWENADGNCNWELLHKPSGLGVRESGDFQVARIALWGGRHVISPEVFVNIELAPGQSQHWSRTYQFFYV